MFFDNASTTQIDNEIISSFQRINNDMFYNPGALYSDGRNVRNFIENSRLKILQCLSGSDSDNMVFTGSATEANNLALMGIIKKNTKKILVSMGEHPSIYNTALEIKSRGYNVEFLKLTSDGKVNFEDFKEKMTRDVDLVSIMHVSNETGAINDIAKLCEYAKSINPKCVFHSDGVQAVGKICVDLFDLGVDMYTMSAHKIHGMKGVGGLYVKKGIVLKPIIFGGGQERGLRSGTENVLGIYSMSRAVEIAIYNLKNNYDYITSLKQQFLSNVNNSGLEFKLNSGDENSPYIVSISFKNCRAETLLNMLSDKNICVGNGSACSASKTGNRILESMGVDSKDILGNLRISFCKNNTIEEVNILSNELLNVVKIYLEKTN